MDGDAQRVKNHEIHQSVLINYLLLCFGHELALLVLCAAHASHVERRIVEHAALIAIFQLLRRTTQQLKKETFIVT